MIASFRCSKFAGLLRFVCGMWLALAVLPCVQGDDRPPFRIQVIDEATGRGVPLVELKTVNDIRYVTDSAGVVAFDEPGLMNQSVFFFVHSHGYQFPKDGFGYAGKGLDVKPGGEATLKIQRRNIAQRLYRVTGGGIYRDTLLTGGKPGIEQPVLNGQVLGSDSVLTARFRNKIYWFWGDTNRPSYPLGNFDVPGAISDLPGEGDLNNPDRGVDLHYFVDDKGFVRPTAKMEGAGPTWIDSLFVIQDSDGRERMFAGYMKIKPPLEIYRRGLAEFDPAKNVFQHVADFPLDAAAYPSGHTLWQKPEHDEYIYFCHPFPLVRVRADVATLADLKGYESYTGLVAGSQLNEKKIDRDADGKIRYAWKKNTPALSPQGEAKLIADGKLTRDEALWQIADRETGRAVVAHHGSVAWNEYRQRWVMIFVEVGGTTSHLGEVWFAEAETPVGPWRTAVKIATHDRYSFYNPKQHPLFDRDGGRIIYFEGTYTRTFSGPGEPTPRYEYNQIMYRLDLDDPRLGERTNDPP